VLETPPSTTLEWIETDSAPIHRNRQDLYEDAATNYGSALHRLARATHYDDIPFPRISSLLTNPYSSLKAKSLAPAVQDWL
jgi:hypothetical protein